MTDTASVASCAPYNAQRAPSERVSATPSATNSQPSGLKSLALKVLERNSQRNISATPPAKQAQLSLSEKRDRVALVLAMVADEFDQPSRRIIEWYRDDIDELFEMRLDDIRWLVDDYIKGGYC